MSGAGRRSKVLPAILAALLACAAGQAAAVSRPYTVEFTTRAGLLLYTQLAGPTLVGSGVAEVGLDGSFAVPAGVIDGAGFVPYTDPAVFPIIGVSISASNEAGTLEATGGVLRVCVFAACGPGTPQYVFPLDRMGAGGTSMISGGLLGNQTVTGAPWTLSQVLAFPGYTIYGSAHGPASGTASALAPGGSLHLVSGLVLQPGFGIEGPYVVIGELRFAFVPEPATALLLAAGVGGLAVAGRARGRPGTRGSRR